MKYKQLLIGFSSLIGGTLSYLIGDITPQMITLLILMLLDLLTGITTALIFNNSSKTNSGGLSSAAMYKGIAKKVGMLILICVAYQIDLTLSIEYVKGAVVIALILEELLSIIENLGLMGVPIPLVIKKSIDLLNEKINERSDKE